MNYKKVLITLGAFAATLLIRFPFNLKKETNIDKMINVLTRYNYNCINSVCSKTVKDYGCTGTTTYNWKANTLSQYTKSDTCNNYAIIDDAGIYSCDSDDKS